MPTPSSTQIETFGLTKRYGDFVALRDLSLKVEAGEIVGLLGPNGAGKSSLIRLLLGAIRPSSGHAQIQGLDCYSQRTDVHRQVAYLPGDARLYRRMRGTEVLTFFSRLRGKKEDHVSHKIAQRLELDLKCRVAAMSTGMRQKLAIAVTLAAQAPILILDEPTANLDPTVRSEVLAMVTEARDRGTTVMFSSHVLSEIEEICDRVVILRKGEMVHHQSLHTLRNHHRLIARAAEDIPAPPQHLASQVEVLQRDDGWLEIETSGELSPVLRWLSALELQDIRIEPLGLSKIYRKWHAQSREATEPVDTATTQQTLDTETTEA